MARDLICSWCNLPMPDDLSGTVMDHIIPRSRGGPDKSWNRQRMHARCNGPAGKGSKLTPEAEALAAEHGVVLREPLPTAWPGSSVKLGSGKENPYRVARERGEPPPAHTPRSPRSTRPTHKVTVRKVYEVECRTCERVIGTEDSWEKAVATKRDHIAQARADHANEPAA